MLPITSRRLPQRFKKKYAATENIVLYHLLKNHSESGNLFVNLPDVTISTRETVLFHKKKKTSDLVLD